MTKYSYTLVVEDIEKSVAFYQQYFNWDADKKGKESAWINTQSPLVFSVVEKNYLYDGLGIQKKNYRSSLSVPGFTDQKKNFWLKKRSC